MVLRKTRRGILLLAIYECLVFIGFFLYFFSRGRRPEPYVKKQRSSEEHENEPGTHTVTDVSFSSSHIPGVLNLHVWNDLCGLEVERLRETPLFPHHPHQRLFLRRFQTSRNVHSYGQRIFGFIEPRVTGLYNFAISSDDSSELWLSYDDKPGNLRLIARVFSPAGGAWTKDGVFSKYPTQRSRNIRLLARNKYFIEALHKQAHGNGHIKVYWRKPGSEKLEAITEQYLLSYFDDRKVNGSAFVQQELERLYTWTPSHVKQGHYKGWNLRLQLNYTSLPFIDSNLLRGILPTCAYKPSYIVERNLSRFQGVKMNLVHYSAVYPNDKTYLKHAKHPWSQGNKLVDNKTVSDVVNKFMESSQIFR